MSKLVSFYYSKPEGRTLRWVSVEKTDSTYIHGTDLHDGVYKTFLVTKTSNYVEHKGTVVNSSARVLTTKDLVGVNTPDWILAGAIDTSKLAALYGKNNNKRVSILDNDSFLVEDQSKTLTIIAPQGTQFVLTFDEVNDKVSFAGPTGVLTMSEFLEVIGVAQ